MNGRVHGEDTPAGRLAAVAASLQIQLKRKGRTPDYADFHDVLKPFIERELILARIQEARTTSGKMLTARIQELAQELVEVNRTLPDENRLVPDE